MATLVGLQYLQNQEQRRHNLATEKQTDLARTSNEAIAAAQRKSQESIAAAQRASNEGIARDNRFHEVNLNEAKMKHDTIEKELDRRSNERINSERNLTNLHLEQIKQTGYDKDRLHRERITSIETDSREAIAAAQNSSNYVINAEKNQTQKTISDNQLNVQSDIAFWEHQLREKLNNANLDEAYLRDTLNFVSSMFNAIGRIIPG